METPLRRRRILEPTDRFSEILFGLIMVLTFTGTLSATGADHDEVRTMLIGALGCNLAWGLVDAVMYVTASMTLRARGNLLLRRLQASKHPEEARHAIASVLPDRIAGVLVPSDLESMRRRLSELPAPPETITPTKDELIGALAVFLLVFLATFPPTIPFMLIHDPYQALRISNAIALVMLFLLGHSLGKFVGGRRPWLLGFGMLLVGGALVAITIALGG